MAAASNNMVSYITNGPEAKGSDNRTFKQINFDQPLIDNFTFDQWRGLEYSYNLEPQSQNLFYAGYFCESGDGDAESDQEDMKMFYNAAYRIKKVTIPFPSMEIEYHPELRTPMVKQVSYQNEISVDWFEDVYHSVQKYHQDWFNRWYSKEYDCFRCGVQGKFRKMAVIAFHYENNNVDSIIPAPIIKPMFAFLIGGLIPKTIPSMTFDYNADGNDQLITMAYHCGPIRWLYSDHLGMGDDAGTGTTRRSQEDIDSLFDDKASTTVQAWKHFSSARDEYLAGNPPSSSDWEKIRIMRAATYYQAAEGSL